MIRTPSLIARIARLTLITGLVLVALILLATYASVPRTPSMMSWWNDDTRNAVTSSGGSGIAIDGYSGGGMMGYAIAPEAVPAPSAASATDTLTLIDTDQRVIKTGSIDMTSNDVGGVSGAISTLATAWGGYTQSSSVSEDSMGRATAFIVLRVPVEKFEAAMTDIKILAAHINSESISGDDITEQYTDVSARLTAAKAQEAQYLIILKSAETVGEILAVQEHLATVRADIESLQGQISYLTNRTDLATISVTISEESTAETASDSKFDPARDANSAVAFVIALGQQALSVLIWVAIIGAAIGIPLGIIALIVWFIARSRNASSKRRR